MLTHGGRPHSASTGCHGTKLDYFKGAAVDVGRCQGLVPYLCSPNSLCASPGSNRCRRRRVAARSALKWPCCLRPAVAEPGTRPGTLKPGHPFPRPKPGFEGVLGGSVSNFCFAARISNARSFSTPPPPPAAAVSRGCSRLCDPETASVGGVLGMRGARAGLLRPSRPALLAG